MTSVCIVVALHEILKPTPREKNLKGRRNAVLLPCKPDVVHIFSEIVFAFVLRFPKINFSADIATDFFNYSLLFLQAVLCCRSNLTS